MRGHGYGWHKLNVAKLKQVGWDALMSARPAGRISKPCNNCRLQLWVKGHEE